MNNEMTNDHAMSFAAWELRLYLNTHPNDERAYEAYRKLCASQGCNYACNVVAEESSNKVSCCGATVTPAPFSSIPGNIRTNTNYQKQNNLNTRMSVSNKKCGRVWHWIDDPWPWEPEANVKGGCR